MSYTEPPLDLDLARRAGRGETPQWGGDDFRLCIRQLVAEVSRLSNAGARPAQAELPDATRTEATTTLTDDSGHRFAPRYMQHHLACGTVRAPDAQDEAYRADNTPEAIPLPVTGTLAERLSFLADRLAVAGPEEEEQRVEDLRSLVMELTDCVVMRATHLDALECAVDTVVMDDVDNVEEMIPGLGKDIVEAMYAARVLLGKDVSGDRYIFTPSPPRRRRPPNDPRTAAP